MLKKLLERIFRYCENAIAPDGLNKVQHILDHSGKLSFVRYMPIFSERYDHIKRQRVTGPPWWFPVNIFIHRWCQSELPVFHTHPGWSISIVLRGGYFEVFEDGKMKFRKPWNIWWRHGGSAHYIKIPSELHYDTTSEEYSHELRDNETITLYIRGRFLTGIHQDWIDAKSHDHQDYGVHQKELGVE